MSEKVVEKVVKAITAFFENMIMLFRGECCPADTTYTESDIRDWNNIAVKRIMQGMSCCTKNDIARLERIKSRTKKFRIKKKLRKRILLLISKSLE